MLVGDLRAQERLEPHDTPQHAVRREVRDRPLAVDQLLPLLQVHLAVLPHEVHVGALHLDDLDEQRLHGRTRQLRGLTVIDAVDRETHARYTTATTAAATAAAAAAATAAATAAAAVSHPALPR